MIPVNFPIPATFTDPDDARAFISRVRDAAIANPRDSIPEAAGYLVAALCECCDDDDATALTTASRLREFVHRATH